MPKSIIFVDSRVANYQSLIDSFTKPADVFVLDDASDGLVQMAAYLQGRTGIDAIHVISHGSVGALYLGSTVLDSGNLASYQSQLASIGGALTETGDILLYGCNVAQGAVGLQFIDSLAQYTGADVAASIDATGAAALGGDWLLEQGIGAIDTPSVQGGDLLGLLPGNVTPTGTVTITGPVTQGQTLTAANTLADADGLGTITYQWKADGSVISGAAGHIFVLTEAQVGKAITVSASYIDGHGTGESVTSSASTAVANINDTPTGAVTISGTATKGQTLTASNTLADIDGLGTISYQWNAGGAAISGATANTLVLDQTLVGKAITLTARYTDGHGMAESVTSNPSTAVTNVNAPVTGTVTIAGTVKQGQTLTAANTLADADGLGTISYQWKAGGVSIDGATANIFTLTEAQVGKAITVSASYIDGHGTGESVTSSASGVVANINDAPTGNVTFSGTVTPGQTLTASNTLADADGLGLIGYQWKADGANISGASSSTLILTEAQVSQVISVTASYTDGHGTAESVSTSTLRHAGGPLTGYITGGAGDDDYIGAVSSPDAYAIDQLHVIDRSGNATVTASVSGSAYYMGSIRGSSFEFGDGSISVDANTTDGYMPAAISSSSFVYGAGNSLTKISIAGGIYWATGISGSTFSLGAGADEINVTVTWNTQAWPLTGISGTTIDAGTGDDRLIVTLNNDKVSTSSWGISGSPISLGLGNDTVVVHATNGIQGGNLATGDGNDTIDVESQIVGISNGTISMGTGDDRLTLRESGVNALSVTGASIDMGEGDDLVQMARGTATLDGGAGQDTLEITGNRSAYNITIQGADVVVASKYDSWTLLTVRHFENLKFSDETVVTNHAPTGTVTITGPVTQGQTLTAANTLADADGLGTITYQWKAAGVIIAGATTSNYTLTQAEVGKAITVTASYTDAMGTAESKTSTPTSAVAVNQTFTGTGASESFTSGPGNDSIDGGTGTDAVVYSISRSNFALAKTSNSFTLTDNTGANGIDTLQNVERLKFSDGAIALDVGATQPAGQTAMLLGAVLPGRLAFDSSKQALLGAAIDLFDQGYSLQTLSGAVMRLPIWDVLTGKATPTNADIATYLLTNVNGVAPDATTLANAVTSLNAETSFSTQGNFLWHLAESSANQTHIGLVGLVSTGLAYGW